MFFSQMMASSWVWIIGCFVTQSIFIFALLQG